MISRLILLRVLMYDSKTYSINDLKEELCIELEEHLYGLLMKYLTKTVKIMSSNFDYESQLKKLISLIEEMTLNNPALLKINANKEKLNNVFRIISKKSNELKRGYDKDILNLLNYIYDKISFIETLSITASVKDNNELYLFLDNLIFEEQNYGLLKKLIQVNPKIIEARNPRGNEPLYINFFKKYLKLMRKDISIEELIFYDKTAELIADLMDNLGCTFGGYDIRREIEKKLNGLNRNNDAIDRNIKMMLLSKLNKGLFSEKDYLSNTSFINFKCNLNKGHISDLEQYICDVSSSDLYSPNENIITIDAENTCAIDDALSVKQLSNGNYLLGIYISDVASYISKTTELDLNACSRGATIYLNNGRQIPMLPNELSFNVCSLFPMIPKRVVSTFVEINENGEIVDYKIAKCSIMVNHRMSYKMVDDIINDDHNNSHLARDIRMLNDVSNLLASRTKRKNKYREVDKYIGNKNELNMEEATKIAFAKKTHSHNIVSEAMILMNYLLAKTASESKIPFLYRVHEIYNMDTVNKKYQTLTSLFRTDEEFLESDLFRQQILNTYLKPKYSSLNKGHNGIGLDYYSHTTSPIRRYADLYNQMIIADILVNPSPIDQDFYYYEEQTPKVAFIQNENEELIEKYILDYQLSCLEEKEKQLVRR